MYRMGTRVKSFEIGIRPTEAIRELGRLGDKASSFIVETGITLARPVSDSPANGDTGEALTLIRVGTQEI
jgi:hypothetical protein